MENNAIENEKIIVTGGTEGLGKAISEELANLDKKVVICARTKEKIEDAKNSGKFVSAYQTDLEKDGVGADFVRKGIEDLGGIDVLVLNAAVTGMKESEESVFKINVASNIEMIQTVSTELRKNNGRIIFLTSASKDIEGAEKYGEAKKEMEEWLEDFSKKEEAEGLSIFSVIPGPCDTRMHREVLSFGAGAVKERTESLVREGKLRNPEIVGKIISKMALSGMNFNPQTKKYDIPIKRAEVVSITDENIKFEEENQG